MTPGKTPKQRNKRPPTPARLEALAKARAARQSIRPLEEGETARPLQIRGPADAVAWFTSLTAQQRGAVVAAAHRAASHPAQEDNA